MFISDSRGQVDLAAHLGRDWPGQERNRDKSVSCQVPWSATYHWLIDWIIDSFMQWFLLCLLYTRPNGRIRNGWVLFQPWPEGAPRTCIHLRVRKYFCLIMRKHAWSPGSLKVGASFIWGLISKKSFVLEMTFQWHAEIFVVWTKDFSGVGKLFLARE